MRLQRSILLIPACLMICAGIIGAAPLYGEDFYEAQLRLARAATAAGDHLEAAELSRVAAFGLMGRPALLSEALVRLTLASSASGRTADVPAILDRFLEVERRYATYASASIEDSFRRSFESILIAHIGRERLGEFPSLARLTDSSPRVPGSKRPVAASVPVVTRPTVIQPAVPLPAPPDDVLTEGRRLLGAGRPGEAKQLLYQQLAKTPGRRELRLALLEAATLDRDWPTAAAQSDLLAPFLRGEETTMFYAAVAMFESGRLKEAKRYLAASKDHVARLPWIKAYIRRIQR